MPNRILSIWLPNWPCQRVMADRPEIAAFQLILWAKDHRRGQVVVTCNGPARSAGVTPGMGMAEALSLQLHHSARQDRKASHGLELIEYAPQSDLESLVALALEAQQFSPIVGLEGMDGEIWAGRNVHAPQGLALDITGLGQHFGSEQQLCLNIARWLQSHRLIGSIAVADTIGCAWAVANFASRKELIERFSRNEIWSVAQNPEPLKERLASQSASNTYGKEDHGSSTHVVPSGAEMDFVDELPIEALRISRQTGHLLRKLGLRRIGEIRALPKESLASRFGATLIERIAQVYGEQSEPIVSVHTLPDLRFDFDIEIPTDRKTTIEEVVRRLVRKLTDRLLDRGEGVLRLLCRFDSVDQPSQLMQLGLFRSSAEYEYLASLLCGAIDQSWKPNAPIHRVLLQATMTGPLIWRQLDFFGGEDAASSNHLVPLIDQLSYRLGRGNVVTAKLDRDPQPERSVHWSPMTGLRPDGKPQKTRKKLPKESNASFEPTDQDPLRRPTTLFKSPLVIEVLAIFPDGVPCRFFCGQQGYDVHRHWGPERIETGWWRGPSSRRDYYRVETTEGIWMWLFRDLQSGSWNLHGIFD